MRSSLDLVQGCLGPAETACATGACRSIGGELGFEHEIDDARWLSVEGAAATLTYERDRDLLAAL